MSDQEFAQWLRSVPREVPADEVERRERQRDAERGEWINPHQFPHHFGESAQH